MRHRNGTVCSATQKIILHRGNSRLMTETNGQRKCNNLLLPFIGKHFHKITTNNTACLESQPVYHLLFHASRLKEHVLVFLLHIYKWIYQCIKIIFDYWLSLAVQMIQSDFCISLTAIQRQAKCILFVR